ncbi:MAG: hypothetical protein CMQ88_03435 [Gammaproteobacteria bacterium]|nr:hypothetical protein [Gammaproteobacteria bacterium]
MKSLNWKICAEIGLNHLGDFNHLVEIYKKSNIANLNSAVSIQVREDEFYVANPDLKIDATDTKKFRKICERDNVPFGLALGPIKSLDWIIDLGLKPDFIKILSLAAENIEFIEQVKKKLDCPIYISTGLSSFNKIREVIVPLLRKKDYLIHTSISHSSKDQNFGMIARMKTLNTHVCFGQHATSKAICFTAIGVGAEKIFVYIGDKAQKIPDLEHAVHVDEFHDFYNEVHGCFDAISGGDNAVRSSNIEFLG